MIHLMSHAQYTWSSFEVDSEDEIWDLCKNSWYDFKKLLWQGELNPRVRYAFGSVSKEKFRHNFLAPQVLQ